jgi:tRNA pseudouridine32 synthase/23S rRNA pseudouridine746 synthase
LGEIFSDNPPAGAGECAAPKLLHYSFMHNLRPISMAEFWWGESTKSEVRRHSKFYPACTSKCEPILSHMLQYMNVEANPLKTNFAEGKSLEIVYEDDVLVVVNKPAEFLSVPGKAVKDSVLERMRQLYPDSTGALLVHRLDMSTSGLLLVAKTSEAHTNIQKQFLKRTIKKHYIALLEGVIKENEGVIELPLRVDLEDRPRQLVCYTHGKYAKTLWKVLERRDAQTLVQFIPVTGRTHQLRVHASHFMGLNAPIVGDDLYGTKAERLCLHAEFIEFQHPISDQIINFKIPVNF